MASECQHHVPVLAGKKHSFQKRTGIQKDLCRSIREGKDRFSYRTIKADNQIVCSKQTQIRHQ